jgi:hypothetical protein
MIKPTLKSLDKGKQVQMNCYDFSSTENDRVPKYTLYVIDSDEQPLLNMNNCACIIVPQGREKDSIFSTEMGRFKLCTQADCSRLVLVFLGAGHVFESLDVVKEELNSKILELSPNLCSNYNKIPFMSLGEDIGQKAIINVQANDGIEGFII